MNCERRLLSKIVVGGEIEFVIKAGITPGMFEDQTYSQVFAYMLDFFQRHGEAPSTEALKRNYPWFLEVEGEEAFHAPDPLAFYVEEVQRSYRYALVHDAITEAAAFMKRGEVNDAWKVMQKLAEQCPAFSGGLTFDVVREATGDRGVPWLCSPWLALGTVTEVTGKVKQAGKTTFVLDMVRAILDGGTFLGARAVKTSVVLLSEQNETSLRASLRRANLLGREELQVSYWAKSRGTPWPGAVAAAVAHCEAVGSDVLIVDTLSQWAGLRGDGENDAGRAMEAMGPLLAAAADGLAVVVVRHDRKSGGAVGDSGRGSSAFAGAVDTVLNIRRDPSFPDTYRVLRCLSRLDGVPEETVVDWDGDHYTLVGDMGTIKATERAEEIQGKILALMQSKPEREWSLSTIRAEIRRGTDVTKKSLDDLVESKRVRRFGNDARPKYAPSAWGAA
ncbi:MAG: AAA family ATPase [Acidimicrobiia bacterium]